MSQAIQRDALTGTMLDNKPTPNDSTTSTTCTQIACAPSTTGGSAVAADEAPSIFQLQACAARGRSLAGQRPATKRPAPLWTPDLPGPKRPRRSTPASAGACPVAYLWSASRRPTARTLAAFDYLRVALHAMTREQREAAILRMDPALRMALLAFMESRRHAPKEATPADDEGKAAQPKPRAPRCEDAAACPGEMKVRVIRTPEGVRYQAAVHVKAMRIYARGQSDVHTARRQQEALLALRRALIAAAARSPNLWEDIAEVWQVCQDALVQSNSGEVDLGLSAFVHLRASRWLGQRCTITSSVMDLRGAIVLHARLLRARRSSWEAFREVWVDMMTRSSRGATPVERAVAEATADAARRASLRECLARALRGAEVALAIEARKTLQMAKLRHQELCRVAKDVATKEGKAFKTRQKTMRERKQQRLQWFRRSGLTTEEMLRGLPPHLK